MRMDEGRTFRLMVGPIKWVTSACPGTGLAYFPHCHVDYEDLMLNHRLDGGRAFRLMASPLNGIDSGHTIFLPSLLGGQSSILPHCHVVVSWVSSGSEFHFMKI